MVTSNSSVTNKIYSIKMNNFARRNNQTFELFKYDVENELYSFIEYEYDIDDVDELSGYNPNGNYYLNLPNKLPGQSFQNDFTSPEFPYSAVGRIKTPLTLGGYGYSTGYMVGSNIFVTAAHCVVDGSTHDFVRNLSSANIYLGESSTYSSTIAHYSKVYVNANYITNYSTGCYDLAICMISSNLGDSTGYFSIDVVNNIPLNGNNNTYVDIGYIGAATNHYQTLLYMSYIGIEEYENINSVIRLTYFYVSGCSGSPIIDSTTGKVVATLGGHVGTNYTYGAVFTEPMYCLVNYLRIGEI